MKGKYTLSIDTETMAKFKEYCQKNGMKISPRVQLLIEDDLANNEK